MTPDLLSNPLALAGLAVAQGVPLSDALTQATTASYNNQQAQAAVAQQQQEQQLHGVLAGIDPNKVTDAQLQQIFQIDPEFGFKFSTQIAKQKQEAQRQKILAGLVPSSAAAPDNSSGAVDPGQLATAGAVLDDPTLISAATFAQGQKNHADELAQNKVTNDRQDQQNTINNNRQQQQNDFTRGESLRDDFTNQSKDFIGVRDAYRKIESAAQGTGKDKDGKPLRTAADDVALIYGTAKLNDPGSVVRESDFDLQAKAGSLPTQLQAYYDSVTKGNKLTDEQVQALVNQSASLYNNHASTQEKLQTRFSDLARRNKLQPEDVVSDQIYRGAPKDADAISEGTIADGPQGAIILKGGKWVPFNG